MCAYIVAENLTDSFGMLILNFLQVCVYISLTASKITIM